MSDFHALKCKGTGKKSVKGKKAKAFKGQCFHCGQYGHSVAECGKKHLHMMKGKGKNKGVRKRVESFAAADAVRKRPKVDTGTTGHGMFFGPILGKLGQV